MRLRRLATAFSAAALACAGAPPGKSVPVTMPSSGEVSGGEVFFLPTGSPGNSAAFGGRRVVGPTVNMTATADGAWGGDLRGRNLHLEVAEGRLSGSAFEVTVERQGEALRLGGLVGDRRVSLRLSPQRFQGTIDGGVCSFDLERDAPGSYQGFLSCTAPGQRSPTITSASLRLSGDAARIDQPALPQLALAVLAVLPL